MNEQELQAEWQYRRLEREAILTDGAPPTPEHRDIAITEADQWLDDWRKAQELL